MTVKHMQVLLQVLAYDCTISGDIHAYYLQLLISVYVVKMKVEFESEGGGKYANFTMLYDTEILETARRVQVKGKVDIDIGAVV